MVEIENSRVWILDSDPVLADKTGEMLFTNYKSSTITVTDLWSPDKVSREGMIVYTFGRKKLSRLDDYDVYPGEVSAPIVTNKLKIKIEGLCSPQEIAFRLRNSQ